MVRKFCSLVLGFYTWTATVFFGAIILDVIYARILRGSPGTSEVGTVFSSVSDLLLLFGIGVVFASIAAVVCAWSSRAARWLFIFSMLLGLLEFLVPVFFSLLLPDLENFSLGPWLRIAFSGLTSLTALGGFAAYLNSKSA